MPNIISHEANANQNDNEITLDWCYLETLVLSGNTGKSHSGGTWWATVHGVARSQTRLSDFTFTLHFHALEKEMATHSSVLARRIPGTGKPGGQPSLGLHRVGHDWSDLAAVLAVIKTWVITSIFKDVEKLLAYTVGRIIKWFNHCEKQFAGSSKS